MRWTHSLALMFVVLSAASSAEPGPPPRELGYLDRFGDPLPEGVLLKLEPAYPRHVGADEITYAPDGRTFVTHGRGRIRIWDARTGMPIRWQTLPSIEYSKMWSAPDGQRAAFLTVNALEIWDLTGGKRLHTVPLGNATAFLAVAFAPNGQHIATVDFTPRENRIRVWNLKTGGNRVVGITEDYVSQMQFAASGQRLITWSHDEGIVRSWDVSNEKELWKKEDRASAVKVAQDGQRVYVTWRDLFENYQGIVYSDKEGRCETTVRFPVVGRGSETAISRDGELVAIVRDERLRVHHIASGKAIQTFRESPSASAFSPDGKLISILRGDWTMQTYDLASGEPLYSEPEATGHDSAIKTIRWSSDGQRLLSASRGMHRDDNWTLCAWNLGAKIDPVTLKSLSMPGNVDFEFLPNGSQVWIANDNRLYRHNLDDGGRVKLWNTGRLSALRLAPGGQNARTLTIQSDLEARKDVWEIQNFDLEKGEITDEHSVSSLEPNHSWALGRRFAINNDRSLDIVTVRDLPPLFLPDRKSAALLFSRDERLIAARHHANQPLGRFRRSNTSKLGGELTIFERVTGQPICQLPPNPSNFDFSPDGRYVAAAYLSGIRVWDLAAGQEVLDHKRPDGLRLESIAYSPDGKRLATGHDDATVLIWDMTLPLKAKPADLAKVEIEKLWADLGNLDAAEGMAAVWALQDRPEQAWKMLKERLRPVTAPTEKEAKQLIDSLDDPAFRNRDRAQKQLAEWGDAVLPALKVALEKKPSIEQRERLVKLLAELDSKQPPRGQHLRTIRCLAILEHIKTPESRKLIQQIAGGMESARVTREAIATLERLP